MSIARRCALVLMASVLGCGPTVQPPEQSDSSGTEGPSDSVGPGTTPGTTTPTTADTTVGTASTGMESDDDPGTTTVPVDDAPGSGECDLFAQDCPRGHKCMPYASDGGGTLNATGCFPIVPDPDGLYDPCEALGSPTSGLDTCAGGMICWHVDPATLEGQCLGMCMGSIDDPQCEDPDAMCQFAADSPLVLCIPTCNPLADECPAGQGCYPTSEEFVCVPDASGDGGAAGQPCEFINVCDPGTACIEASLVPTPECMGALGCCSSYCEVGQPPAVCLPGQECMAWWEAGTAPPGLEDVGICATP